MRKHTHLPPIPPPPQTHNQPSTQPNTTSTTAAADALAFLSQLSAAAASNSATPATSNNNNNPASFNFTLPAHLLAQSESDAYFEEFQAELNFELASSINPIPEKPLLNIPSKKTPFQLKKEAEEARKKKDEQDTKRALEEFEASFKDSSVTYSSWGSGDADGGGGASFVPAKTWVKGSTIVPKHSIVVDAATHENDTNNLVGDDGLYRPHLKFSNFSSRESVQNSKSLPDSISASTIPAIHSASAGPKKRQLDSFLEEIKQQSRSDNSSSNNRFAANSSIVGRNAAADAPSSSLSHGSHDTGDGTSTNLFVGNLHPSVNESLLCTVFGEYGPIGSVKVMWPRTQEEIDRDRNTGFIGFMRRADAERAIKGLDGYLLEGRELRVGWGKAIPIPENPIYVTPEVAMATGDVLKYPTPVSGLPFNAQIPAPSTLKRKHNQPPPRPQVLVQIPEDVETLMRINRCIEFVIVHGPAFEALLMGREQGNSDYAFLFDHTHPYHSYYRWKIFSLMNGDSKTSWPTKSFAMFDEGPVWVPPEPPINEGCNDSDTDSATDSSDSDSSHKRRKSRRQQLSNSKAKKAPTKQFLPRHKIRLQNRLQNLTNTRPSIATAMLFCLSHATTDPSAITTTITQSLTHTSTPLATKLARLHLVNDILHNSANPHVPAGWKYRGLFEKSLRRVYVHFGSCWRAIDARLRAEQWKRACLGVVGVWERWNVFDMRFLEGLRIAFQEGTIGGMLENADDLSGGGSAGVGVSESRAQTKQRPSQQLQHQQLQAKSSGWNNNDVDDEDVDGVPMGAITEKEPVVAKSAGFKPIDSGDFARKFVSIGSDRGVAASGGQKFVRAAGGQDSETGGSASHAGFKPIDAPAPAPVAKPVAAPSTAKKINQIVAGAASVFQMDDSDDE
ncbi:U2 snRNP-associated SURP domain-containing protein [Physocladia obscura]|uniref:U2 snRNP-associated SURP domain-containing protein n=1 Tax=Physocladia obscura TaxID=109957 RepID=A0AAD5T3H9_9FUNG|nr:U2 snRNP-associated SURP domain-containing protein [Physocladia obscura]